MIALSIQPRNGAFGLMVIMNLSKKSISPYKASRPLYNDTGMQQASTGAPVERYSFCKQAAMQDEGPLLSPVGVDQESKSRLYLLFGNPLAPFSGCTDKRARLI